MATCHKSGGGRKSRARTAAIANHQSIYESPVKGVLLYGHLRTTLPSSPPDFVADQVLAFPPDHRWHVHRDAAGNIVRGGP